LSRTRPSSHRYQVAVETGEPSERRVAMTQGLARRSRSTASAGSGGLDTVNSSVSVVRVGGDGVGSVGPAGSVGSVGSAGSVGSVGSVGSGGSVGSVGPVGSVREAGVVRGGHVLVAVSLGRRAFQAFGARRGHVQAGAVPVAGPHDQPG